MYIYVIYKCTSFMLGWVLDGGCLSQTVWHVKSVSTQHFITANFRKPYAKKCHKIADKFCSPLNIPTPPSFITEFNLIYFYSVIYWICPVKMWKDQTLRNVESVSLSSFVYCLPIFGRLYIATWGGDFLGGNFFFEASLLQNMVAMHHKILGTS